MSSTISRTTTRTSSSEGEMKLIQNQHPLNFAESIIPRWSDELRRTNNSLFASTSIVNLPRRISAIAPPDSGVTIRTTTRPIAGRATTQTKVATIDSVASTHLASKLAGDALVAIAVTFGTSPFLTVVDKAIVESTAGTNSLLRSAVNSVKSMARNPVEYLKSPTFLLMWGVYSATYTTANSFKTLEEHATYSRDRSSSSSGVVDSKNKNNNHNNNNGMFKMAAFLGTTFVNSGASMFKDRAYARMFSGTSSATSFPRSTYALWMMRDFSVIGSSFLLPDIVSSKLVEHYGEGDMDRERARNLCQIGLPVLAQFVASPFQYLGLDMYNRPLSNLSTRQAFMDRSRQMSKGIVPIICARIARIIPGYSIGGVANTKLRTAWREKLLQRDVEAMMKNNNNKSNSNNKEYATRMVALLHGGNNNNKTSN